jgi:hypothetical protein
VKPTSPYADVIVDEALVAERGPDLGDFDWSGEPGSEPADETPPRRPEEFEARRSPRVVSLATFVATVEPGAEAILGGGEDDAILAVGGDALASGDAGVGKSTALSLDLPLHIGEGLDWHGIPVLKPRRVAVLEAEGPRPFFRVKFRRRLAAWSGSLARDNVLLVEEPWGDFTFDDGAELARLLGRLEVDLLVANPVSAIGGAGATLPETRPFMAGVDRFRRATGRPLSVLLIHHDNVAGQVSGAWPGVVDTLIHVEAPKLGHIAVRFVKPRHAPGRQGQVLNLAYAPGESFREAEAQRAEDRNIGPEVERWVAEHPLESTQRVREGVGFGETPVTDALAAGLAAGRLRRLTGDEARAHGAHPNAHLWEVVDDDG